MKTIVYKVNGGWVMVFYHSTLSTAGGVAVHSVFVNDPMWSRYPEEFRR